MVKKILSLCLCVFMIGTAFLTVGVSAEGAEMRVFYDLCHTLDNVWSSNNITVVDDIIGEANYNNGGKMIGMVEADYKGFEIVYKVPEGRSFKSFFTEVSFQDLATTNLAKLAYSEDGTSYTDFTFSWTSGSAPGSGQNDAGWARKNTTTVTAPENTDVRFIKIYHEGAAMTHVKKFYLRKVSLITAGGEIFDESVTDELTGDSAEIYDISNFTVYDLLNSADANAVATVPDRFTDSNLMGIKNLSQDAYIIYKAGENRAFTKAQVQNLAKDNASVLKLYASKDGHSYDLIEDVPVFTFSTIDSDPESTASDGFVGWNRLETTTGTLNAGDSYKYIKILVPGGSVGGLVRFKLANVTLSTVDMSMGCITGDVYEEQFDSEMYHIYEAKNAESGRNRLSVTKDGYVSYKTLPAREMKKIELTAGDSWNGVLEAMDINKNKIMWNTEITKETSGGSTIITSEIPDGAAYVKISGEAVYTGITIETDDASGSEWTYIDGSASLSAELSGEPIETLQSGCTVSFSIPVKNAGSEQQSAKAYLCLFEGDRMDRIEEFDADIAAGEKITVSGSMDIEAVTPNTTVTVFLWTDLDSMIALGTEQNFASK